MLKRTSLQIILILLLITTAVIGIAAYYSYQLPSTQIQTATLGSYQHNAFYDYTAYLKDNIIYNKTELRPGEGILYTALVKQVNITFSYEFSSTPYAENRTLNYQHSIQIISLGKWVKNLTINEAAEIFHLTEGSNYQLSINTSKVEAYIRLIDDEVGTSTQNYVIRVNNEIAILADTAVGRISDRFLPTLEINFKQDPTVGRYISIEPLVSTQSKNITQTYQAEISGIQTQRIALLAGSVFSSLCFLITLFFYNKAPRLPRSPEKILEQYKEFLVESLQEPPAKILINVQDLKELSKVADTLAKPILHIKNADEHIFVLLDGDAKYQYKVKESKLIK